MSFDACYRALQARDARFDGLFFVGVSTTGIYCRPVCPARTPKISSCQFFPKAALAEQAGFRPCLRCRPELAPAESRPGPSLAQTLYRAIQKHALSGASLPNLSTPTGYSSRQLRRLMGDAFGLTPVAIVQTERLLFAKKLLQETSLPITRIALDAGFGSLRRFNTLFRTRYQMAPRDLRAHHRTARPDDLLHLRLAYRPPLAWPEMLAYLQFRAIPGVEAITGTTYARTFSFDENPGWLSVRALEGSDALEVTVPANFSPHLAEILGRLRQLFDLDANPEKIAEHLRKDPRFRPTLKKSPGLRVPGAWNVFELSVRAILGQQISVTRATVLAGALTERFGRTVVTPIPALHRICYSAKALAASHPDTIAALGMPASRGRTLHEFAKDSEAGKFDFPPATAPDEILATLQSGFGIGPWTANYIAMRALRLPDAFPTADLVLLKATGLKSGRDLEALSQKWRPWRAYATLHLWQSL